MTEKQIRDFYRENRPYIDENGQKRYILSETAFEMILETLRKCQIADDTILGIEKNISDPKYWDRSNFVSAVRYYANSVRKGANYALFVTLTNIEQIRKKPF